MKPATYLMNSTKKEYMFVGAEYPSKIGTFLLILEQSSKWDLRHDTIYISHSTTTYDYKNIRDFIIKDGEDKNGGEIIEETIKLY
jgi:hypothetical protein